SMPLRLSPALLPAAFASQEMRRASLQVRVRDVRSQLLFAQNKSVLVHGSSDIYWGRRFSNAQVLARWVTPHDPAVLKLVADSRRFAPGGRFRGYAQLNGARTPVAGQVRAQSEAVFRGLVRSKISYVNSLFTFGEYVDSAQRVRLPSETLSLSSANCVDVS